MTKGELIEAIKEITFTHKKKLQEEEFLSPQQRQAAKKLAQSKAELAQATVNQSRKELSRLNQI